MKLSLRHLVTFLGIFVVALLSGTTGSQAQGRRVALVIGNSAYVSATKLDNPINDAEDMAATLERLGFAVLKGIDLSKAGMDAIIRQFAEAMGGAKAGLLFYAGHGLQVGGQNYLVPIDAKLTTSSALDFEMVRLDLIQRAMEREASTNIIILDACRDNPLARNLARALGTRSSQVGHGFAPAESGRRHAHQLLDATRKCCPRWIRAQFSIRLSASEAHCNTRR